MTTCLSDSLNGVRLTAVLAALVVSRTAFAAEQPLPPERSRDLPELLALPSTRAPEPMPEPETVKVRLNGEYEARQSFLTDLPLVPLGTGPTSLGQTSRLFHWLRLRGLLLFAERWELRAAADLPRGMIYGQEPTDVPDSGSDFERIQPVRFHPRQISLTLRGELGEVSVGHTTTQMGLGLVDADGDQPRFFGTPERPATYERLELTSGTQASTLRVGAAADLLFDDGRLSLAEGDQLLRTGLTLRFTPSKRSMISLLARYEGLRRRGARGGAQSVLFDLWGHLRGALPGGAGQAFVEYEGAYRVGGVSEPTAFAARDVDQSLATLAFATRAGFSLDRVSDRRYSRLVISLGWGMASGDADPTDSELHRFVMNPNHGVGLILFSEIMRFKTSRAQAQLAATGAEAAGARVYGLATRGGAAGASYLNPVLLVRPLPDLALKLGGVMAASTTPFVNPAALAERGARENFDGGSPLGRDLGTELDVGAELTVPLDAPMRLRVSIEGAVAFPGSAFDDADGRGLGTQAISTAGIGLTF
jgi:hypothetical protein